ncbi:uncharacterized protein [Physcomitrium patens]|uniref:Translation initiation factor IF-3 n=1 Tax=Physcomitrium patens TaxID=3218 RepID=A9S7Q4_PHYPA|nr:uncharacterized protein LOC112278277 [Physcomitrium patens]PNR26258.1 hypothetical protein PHYPA_030832 [Physcomitrium patens]|eukprot:XP_024367292.1 uncharacterized protein LOC112278277 [Physcomitrella patens]
MRHKLWQWLMSRVSMERRLDLGKKSLDLGVCNRGAAEGTGRGGFVSAVRVDYGADGLRTAEMHWNFRSSRFYAVPVAAGRSDGNGVGSREGIKGERKINRAIVARMVRLVGDGSNEILSRYEALNRAQQAGLDLVEVDGKADPPVCKLMDFSKERFKVKKQEKDLRKKQLERRRLDDLKEVRFSSRTEQKDLDMKADVVTRLLVRGHRVKLVVQFHGNDKGEEVGVKLLERAMNLLQAEFKVENGPRVEKMRAWVMIRPIQEQKNTKNNKSSNTMSKDENLDD